MEKRDPLALRLGGAGGEDLVLDAEILAPGRLDAAGDGCRGHEDAEKYAQHLGFAW